MKKAMLMLGAGVLMLGLAMPAISATVGGVVIKDNIQLGKHELVLNGAGLRTKVVFTIYIGSLYLEKKQKTVDAIFADKGAKRISLYVMRQLSAGDFMEAFNKAINENHTKEEYAPLAARLLHFGRVFREVGEVSKGSEIILDYVPETEMMVLTVNGKERERIQGADFYRAMMKIWLGEKPVQDSLKKAMLRG